MSALILGNGDYYSGRTSCLGPARDLRRLCEETGGNRRPLIAVITARPGALPLSYTMSFTSSAFESLSPPFAVNTDSPIAHHIRTVFPGITPPHLYT
ncbi:hypothetical protein SKAU_G00395290 [Synaphobranchus kaupii]|uniref:Uncharacterized protein n=1 Tax=Synaphobranchus kaupii TaxID=118154 RepID=A0A9Q1ECF3_SYNKA|nr:hypothetical protein SKAU_G00395290 [Synaphobranchus kaupii]